RLWKYWVETREGGLHLGDDDNVTIEIVTEIIAEDIPNDTPNSLREPLTRNATRRLLLEREVDVLIGPFGTARTLWAMYEKNQSVGDNIPFLSAGAGGEAIFATGSKNVWGVGARGVSLIERI